MLHIQGALLTAGLVVLTSGSCQALSAAETSLSVTPLPHITASLASSPQEAQKKQQTNLLPFGAYNTFAFVSPSTQDVLPPSAPAFVPCLLRALPLFASSMSVSNTHGYLAGADDWFRSRVFAPAASVFNTPTGADLPLLPNLFAPETVPGFTLDFRNDTAQTISLLPLLEKVTLTLDGKEYITRGFNLFGNAYLAANQTRTFTFHLTSFTLINDTENWPLKAGRHTVAIQMGGKRFGPLRFVCNGQVSQVK